VRQEIEAGGLAGAVGPDQTHGSAAPDGQGHVLNRNETLEFLGQSPRFEDYVIRQTALSPAVVQHDSCISCSARHQAQVATRRGGIDADGTFCREPSKV